jgi:hypothetical protein
LCACSGNNTQEQYAEQKLHTWIPTLIDDIPAISGFF